MRQLSSALAVLISVSFLGGLHAGPSDLDFKAKPPFTLTTKSGKIYERSRVVDTDAKGIRILHADGAASIPASELSAELLKEHGFDPQQTAKLPVVEARATVVPTVPALPAVALPNELDTVAETRGFNALRESIQVAVQGGLFDFGTLDTIIIQAVTKYRAAGKQSWVDALEADREALVVFNQRRRLASRLNQQAAYTQPAAPIQKSLSTSRLYSYGPNPLARDYYWFDRNTRPLIYRCPDRSSANSTYLGRDRNGTGGGGYVPPAMSGGLDSHGGYTPPNLR